MEGGEGLGGRIGTLCQLVDAQGFDDAMTLFSRLTWEQAFEEITYQQVRSGLTAVHLAMFRGAPLALVSKMRELTKSNPLTTNIFTIDNDYLDLPLHYCARFTTDLAVLEFTINEYPLRVDEERCLRNSPGRREGVQRRC